MSGPFAGAVMIDLLRTRGEMLGGAVAIREDAGRLEDDIDAEILPRKLGGILDRQHFELLAIDGDASLVALTSACRLPSTESVLQQVRERGGVVRSLTATKSMSFDPKAARMMLRPIRPNPLMPTLTAIVFVLR